MFHLENKVLTFVLNKACLEWKQKCSHFLKYVIIMTNEVSNFKTFRSVISKLFEILLIAIGPVLWHWEVAPRGLGTQAGGALAHENWAAAMEEEEQEAADRGSNAKR